MRLISSFTFTLKHILQQWGENKQNVWADPDEGSVWLGNEKIAEAAVHEGEIKVQLAPGWGEWLDDESFPEYANMMKDLNAKLAKGKGSAKGLQKGGKAKSGKGIAGKSK